MDTPSTPQPVLPQNPAPRSHKRGIVIVLCVIVVLAVAGVFAYLHHAKQKMELESGKLVFTEQMKEQVLSEIAKDSAADQPSDTQKAATLTQVQAASTATPQPTDADKAAILQQVSAASQP